MKNKDKNFELAVDYFEMIGDYKFDDGETVREKLKLNTDVSMWDILATYLIIYRFPLLFASGHNRIKTQLFSYCRVFKGVIGSILDSIMLSFTINRNKEEIIIKNNKKVNLLFLGFKDAYYNEILFPIKEEFKLNKNIYTYVINQRKNLKTILNILVCGPN